MNWIVNTLIKPPMVWIARKSVLADRMLKFLMRLAHVALFAYSRLRHSNDSRTVLFFSFMGRKFADSPRAIFEEMIADPRFAEWTFIWAFRGKVSEHFHSTYGSHERVETVTYNGMKFFAALARAQFWVSNSHVTDGVRRPRDTVYLQTWHGTPLKKLGADIPIHDSNMPKKTRNYASWYKLQASKWSYLTSQSPYFTDKISSAFLINELTNPPQILETGLPRNSLLFAEQRELAVESTRIRDQLGVPAGKKVLLYAPTFRDNQHSSSIGYTYNLGIDFAKLRADIGEDWVVLFRAHYFVANSLNLADYSGFVFDVSGFDDINDLFIASDALVTDYSSSMVDYTNTGKPIIIYAYDLDEYGNELRGFYVPVEDFPGPIFTEQSELAAALGDLAARDVDWALKRAAFRAAFATWDSRESTRKVIDAVFGV